MSDDIDVRDAPEDRYGVVTDLSGYSGFDIGDLVLIHTPVLNVRDKVMVLLRDPNHSYCPPLTGMRVRLLPPGTSITITCQERS